MIYPWHVALTETFAPVFEESATPRVRYNFLLPHPSIPFAMLPSRVPGAHMHGPIFTFVLTLDLVLRSFPSLSLVIPPPVD